jgi:phenylpyruvate tautomerase PptA (4-oxalocrotonate tautomerase family)
MPMIDVYATAGTFSDPHALAAKLAEAPVTTFSADPCCV